jgi:hypothetical protein
LCRNTKGNQKYRAQTESKHPATPDVSAKLTSNFKPKTNGTNGASHSHLQGAQTFSLNPEKKCRMSSKILRK